MKTKSELKKSVWGHIFQLIVPHKKRFIGVVIIGLLGTGANLVEPLIYREAINDVAGLFVGQGKGAAAELTDAAEAPPAAAVRKVRPSAKKIKEPHSKGHVAERSPTQALETLLWAVGLIFLVNLAGYILTLAGENLNVRLSCLIEQRFIQGTFTHVLKLPLGFFSKRSSAAISKQINQADEVSGIVNGFSQQIAWRSANKLEASLASYYERWEDVSSRMQDAIGGIKTVKLSGAEDREAGNLRKAAGAAYEDYIGRAKLSNKYVFWQNTLTQVSSALVLGYGGYLTLQHKLTPGDVVMFVSYLDRLYSPIDSLASLWVNLQQNAASVARAFRLLEGGMEESAGAGLKIEKGKVEFENVRFSYVAGREVLKGISFRIEPGKLTAIVGASGAGKTTVVDLLLKLYEPGGGGILIDGQDLSERDAASVRSQIGMVTADGTVFRGTLADNIRYKRPAATDDEVLKAAAAAGMENTLLRLPDGLKTAVGEGGIGLSVGERQRIQIARILVSQPRILVLDEATANLDYATEAEIKKTVNEIRRKNTVIVIAHRYSMVRDADHAIVLSAGEVLEQGSPEELISKGGWFSSFAAAADNEECSAAASPAEGTDEGEDEDLPEE
ncbi:MAG: ABC transporter ATP-binding protein [Elusimicrobia bacterium]|nr:ABC transporter ATP-binding protein [Elusimicrobiota bacterium]